MESILFVAQTISSLLMPLVLGFVLVALICVIIVCCRAMSLLKQMTMTAESVQQLSQLPLQIVTSLLQKLLGTNE